MRLNDPDARVLAAADDQGAEGINESQIMPGYRAAAKRLVKRELLNHLDDGRLVITVEGRAAIGLDPAPWQLPVRAPDPALDWTDISVLDAALEILRASGDRRIDADGYDALSAKLAALGNAALRRLRWENAHNDHERGDQNADSELVAHGYWSLGGPDNGRWHVELIAQNEHLDIVPSGGVDLGSFATEAEAKAAAQAVEDIGLPISSTVITLPTELAAAKRLHIRTGQWVVLVLPDGREVLVTADGKVSLANWDVGAWVDLAKYTSG